MFAKKILLTRLESVNAMAHIIVQKISSFAKKKKSILSSNIQGMAGRYDLSLNENNELVVYDTKISEFLPAIKMENQRKMAHLNR